MCDKSELLLINKSQKNKEIIMAFNLKNRHLLSLVNHSEREIKYLLDLARDLKRAKYAGTEQKNHRMIL